MKNQENLHEHDAHGLENEHARHGSGSDNDGQGHSHPGASAHDHPGHNHEQQHHEDPDPEPPHGHPKVYVTYTGSGETASFHVAWGTTLHQVWDEAYDRLQEVRKAGDEFRCAHKDGPSLMERLGENLEQLYSQDICTDHKFKIRTPTGGA